MVEVNARIKIVTRTEGKRTVSEAPAVQRITEEGRFVRFSDGADSVSLTLSNGRLFLLREGERGQRAEFVPGVLTDFVLRIGSFEGGIPLYTHLLKTEFDGDGFSVSLSYELRFEESLQRFRLSIFVRSFSEEA